MQSNGQKIILVLQEVLGKAKKGVRSFFNGLRSFLRSNIERLRTFILLIQVVVFVLSYLFVDPFAGATALVAGRLLLSLLAYFLGEDGRTGEDLGSRHYK